MKKVLPIIANDPYLSPYSSFIENFISYSNLVIDNLQNNAGSLSDSVNGHLYYGLNQTSESWVFREWAPNASEVWLIGDFNDWKKNNTYKFSKNNSDDWELILPFSQLKHGNLYKLIIVWPEGEGERIPAWATRVVQDTETLIFSAMVWAPSTPYRFKNKIPSSPKFPIIYEAHIGMSSEEGKVASYDEFRTSVLPRIVSLGYNVIQLMAIQEHPYYGSFGYHVSSFFAASSRFGTPEELKQLIDEAHGYGISVIMDIVHSHAVKNEIEGLGKYDGTEYQFFHAGVRGQHPAWDSLCFDYQKPEVLHFLLSNCKYWLDVFKFDGFRFDGVTSMIYLDHGLGRDFLGYADYYNPNLDVHALAYLRAANMLIHQLNPNAITIAEEMSGLPGMASPIDEGGVGFDYRLAMGIPDFWIKTIKELPDEQWSVGEMFYQLTNKRADERVISYLESHDQALVGDKTIIFRLIDSEMYYNMRVDQQNVVVERGIALHKMLRLLTISTAQGGYLNFMGNEFGHPEWIDFPRLGNNWSYHYARRQWSLADNPQLRYHHLLFFDKEMVRLMKMDELLLSQPIPITRNQMDQVLIFSRGNFIFVFNFNATSSFQDYGILGVKGSWKIILNTDNSRFGGYERVDESIVYISQFIAEINILKLYIPSRTALVLEKIVLP